MRIRIRTAFASALKPLTGLLRNGDKKSYELKYWRAKSIAEGGALKHAHYQQFYTNVFGLTQADYEGKSVLDIGCGPRGSLEWADMAPLRVGLDPLALDYVKLRSTRHQMSYVAAASEDIPFADGQFDIITSFNSLDHVDDLQKTITEIKRIAKPEALMLLIVEINHRPTPTEPITLRRGSLELFAPEYTVDKSWACALRPGKRDIYRSVLEMKEPTSDNEDSILCARMRRNQESGTAQKCA